MTKPTQWQKQYRRKVEIGEAKSAAEKRGSNLAVMPWGKPVKKEVKNG